MDADYVAASDYYRDALLADPQNLSLMEKSITAYMGTGQGGQNLHIAAEPRVSPFA